MNKITLILNILGLTTLLSCNRTDFANPEDVIKSYRTLSKENKNETLYEDYLSSRSKEFVTKDEFIKTRNISDSSLKSTTILDRKIFSYPIDVNNPSYRRYKVDEINLINKDTVYDRWYYSLINENGKWKVIWYGTLLSFAEKKFADGNYSEARKTLEKIIDIDPFGGKAYLILAWCFYRDKSLTRSEWENGVVKNAKYAVALEEDNCYHYNTLAAYYSSIGNSDLAIQNFQRGLSYCLNKKQKTTFYSNLANEYMTIMSYDEAEEYIKKSIIIDDKDSFVWYKYGELMQVQNKNDEAIKYFEKALKGEKMENSVQGSLFYSYAFCCLNKGNCGVAREYANKALDIDPGNDSYQALYNKVKYCDAKTQ